MPAFAEMPAITGADGATIKPIVSGGVLQIDYATPGTRGSDRNVFLALRSDEADGSAVIPFGQKFEGSTVFLPFRANTFYCFTLSENSGDTLDAFERKWKISRWSEQRHFRTDHPGEDFVRAGTHDCTIRIPLDRLGNPKIISLVIYSKDMTKNDGWGEMFGCIDAAILPGINDKYIPRFLEISTDEKNPTAALRARLGVGEKNERVRIYQLLVRLFGNTNETRKINGTLAENGVGKFADINDAALDAISAMGFTHIWLTGILQQATATDYSQIGRPADDPDLLKGLAGSPYAIKDYFDVCPDYAVDPAKRLDEFKALLARIHAHGLKALIDLVPNHVARSYDSAVMPEISFGARDDKTKFFDPQNNFFYLRASDPGGGPPLKLPTCRDGKRSARLAKCSVTNATACLIWKRILAA